MKELYLPIKQEYFDQILAGTKKEEYREVRPSTFSRYLRYVVNGEQFKSLNDVPNCEPYNSILADDGEGFDIAVVPYDQLYLCVGYNSDRDTMRVKVDHIEYVYFDTKGRVVFVDENGFPELFDQNGKPYEVDKDGNPTRTLQEYTYTDPKTKVTDTYLRTMMIYILGDIVETNIHPKKGKK